MANKPTVLESRFAVDGSDADSPLIGSGPLSGLRDSGYAVDDVPKSGDFDYLFNKYYRWLQYLDDGQFSGESSFDSDLDIGGQLYPFVGKVFTAVNATETFTATAHGLQTGDGPVQVSNAGGALPTGLAAATDYWVIKVTANTFKLATSFLNAMAGTNLLISTDGTGTQTLVSTGGTIRSRDLDVSGVLTVHGNLSAVGNTIATTVTADVITADDYRRTGSWIRKFTPTFLFQSGGVNGFFPAVNPDGGSRPSVFGNSASTSSSMYAGTWNDGDRIIGASLYIYGNGNNFTFQILHTTLPNIAMTTLGSETMISVSAGWTTITISSFTPQVLAASDMLRMMVLLNGGSAYVGDVALQYDRLP